MKPNDVKPGIYMRPHDVSTRFPKGLYEVTEVSAERVVEYRDCRDRLGEDWEPLETTLMQIVQSMVLVEPEPESLDDMLEELLEAA
jgi:hypothetical protein